MITYKIEPISGENYKLKINDSDCTLTKRICLRDIPGVVQALGSMGGIAEKIEWHCCEK